MQNPVSKPRKPVLLRSGLRQNLGVLIRGAMIFAGRRGEQHAGCEGGRPVIFRRAEEVIYADRTAEPVVDPEGEVAGLREELAEVQQWVERLDSFVFSKVGLREVEGRKPGVICRYKDSSRVPETSRDDEDRGRGVAWMD